MAYDLFVGDSPKHKNENQFVGNIEYEEHPAVLKLLKRKDHFFLNRLANIYEDQCFGQQELHEAQDLLHEMMLVKDLSKAEKMMVYKLIAFISYGLKVGMPLYGIAD